MPEIRLYLVKTDFFFIRFYNIYILAVFLLVSLKKNVKLKNGLFFQIIRVKKYM